MRRWFTAILACALSLVLIAGCSAPPEAESPGQTSGPSSSQPAGQTGGQSGETQPRREVQGVTDTTV
ncbi:MAG: hypothetical protein CWE10_13265, partial [Symbiobacterium thermophilum]|nr:hypothetical protein [Symbiobacterium thermophilum]